MWNNAQGHDYIRLIDEKNVTVLLIQAMVRHYKKLQQIKGTGSNLNTTNRRYIRTKTSDRKMTRAEREHDLKIKEDNTKLVKALEDISSAWGK